ncbi:MAG: sensor histidine kinase [Lysobacteraceae bacterium]
MTVSRSPCGTASGDPSETTQQTLPWGADMWLLRYRRHPIFSWPWLWRRTLLWGAGVMIWSGFGFFGFFVLSKDLGLSLHASLMSYATLMLAHSVAPMLAALAYLRWRGTPRVNAAVVVAVLLGFVIAMTVHGIAYGYKAEYLKSTSLATIVSMNESFTGGLRLVYQGLVYAMNLAVFYVFGGGHALWAYFRQQRRLKDGIEARKVAALQAQKQDTELRMSVLQAQVEPHFLFNTLASVRALVRTDPAQAEAALDAFVAYLRASIPRLRSDAAATVSTLGQQLDLCGSYLEVMRIRTAGRLQHAVQVDASLRDAAFPPMLLITLVENAIKHGIEPKPGPGRVTISATRDGDVLHVVVDDDGVGLQPGVGGGLGLANVRAQLDALYGKRADVDLRSRGTGGVRAELRLPMAHAA